MTAARPRRPAPRRRMFLDADGKPLPFLEAVGLGPVGRRARRRRAARAGAQGARQACRGPTCSRTSIAAARDGFPVSPRLAAWLDMIKAFRDEPAARATYFNADGSPKKQGDRIVNPALADTMQRIAERGRARPPRGADRRGDGGARARPRAAGHAGARRSRRLPGRSSASRCAGPIASGSSAACRRRRRAASRSCRCWRCSSRSISRKDKPNDLRALHLIAEASRLAFADRAHYVADPAFVAGADRRLLVAGLHRRAPQADLRQIAAWARRRRRSPPGYVEHGTSHMTIVDRAGQRGRLHHHHRSAVRRRR